MSNRYCQLLAGGNEMELECASILYYWSNTLHVSDGLSVHHQGLKTVHNATGICQTDTADCLLTET